MLLVYKKNLLPLFSGILKKNKHLWKWSDRYVILFRCSSMCLVLYHRPTTSLRLMDINILKSSCMYKDKFLSILEPLTFIHYFVSTCITALKLETIKLRQSPHSSAPSPPASNPEPQPPPSHSEQYIVLF